MNTVQLCRYLPICLFIYLLSGLNDNRERLQDYRNVSYTCGYSSDFELYNHLSTFGFLRGRGCCTNLGVGSEAEHIDRVPKHGPHFAHAKASSIGSSHACMRLKNHWSPYSSMPGEPADPGYIWYIRDVYSSLIIILFFIKTKISKID
jgi:hypothetical protein